MNGIHIEKAANGYIARPSGGLMSAEQARQVFVFDSFERLVDWMSNRFQVDRPGVLKDGVFLRPMDGAKGY